LEKNKGEKMAVYKKIQVGFSFLTHYLMNKQRLGQASVREELSSFPLSGPKKW
jgi:hypothetical protein